MLNNNLDGRVLLSKLRLAERDFSMPRFGRTNKNLRRPLLDIAGHPTLCSTSTL